MYFSQLLNMSTSKNANVAVGIVKLYETQVQIKRYCRNRTGFLPDFKKMSQDSFQV